MAKTRFATFFDRAIEYEGRVTEDVPGDNGGPTKWGITLGRYCDTIGVKTPKRGTADFEKRKAELFDLTEEQIRKIYRRDYWDAVRADELPKGLDIAVADFGLNSGPSRAVKYLQMILGNPQTGRMDDETLREAREFNTTELVTLYMDARAKFLDGIVAKNPKQRKFLKGWMNRVADVRKMAWADVDKKAEPAPPVVLPKAEPSPPPPPPAPPITKTVIEETKEAVKSPTNAIGAGALAALTEWVFGWTHWVYAQLPEMSSEVSTSVEPLKALGEVTKTNVSKIVVPMAFAAIATVLYRNWKNKKEKKRLAAQLKELTHAEA